MFPSTTQFSPLACELGQGHDSQAMSKARLSSVNTLAVEDIYNDKTICQSQIVHTEGSGSGSFSNQPYETKFQTMPCVWAADFSPFFVSL